MEDWGERVQLALLPATKIELNTLSAIATAAAALILVWCCQRHFAVSWTKRGRLPPGPTPWPIVGDLPLLARKGNLIQHSLAALARDYGPLMSLKLGSHTAVVASTASMAKEILKTQNHNFCSRSQTTAGEILSYNRRNVVWAPYGESLRTVRRIITREVFNAKNISSTQAIREEVVLSCAQEILEECKGGKEPINLADKMALLSLSNIARMVFGTNFFDSRTSAQHKEEVTTLVRAINGLLGVVVVGDFVPCLKRFDIQGYEAKMRELAIRQDDFYTRIVDDHRNRKSEHPDFVDALLSLSAKETLSEPNLKGILADMIFGGTDTSATTLSWTFAELMRHPGVLQRALEELDVVVGRERLLREDDIPNLTYLQAVVKESFRLHPVAGILPYESIEATHVGGHYIPPKTRVFVNNYAISRDPGSWDRPLDFRPERFLNESTRTRDVKGQDFELLPFGAGRRVCIGMNLGLLMVQFAMGQLLHVCAWSLPPGVAPHDVDITEDVGISTPMKSPLRLIATHRLPPSVLSNIVHA